MCVYCRSRISWVLALSVVVSWFVGTAFAADAITTVEVVGNRTVGAELIRSHLRAGRAGNISAAQIDEALKSLFATGLFADVRIDRKGAKLLISVKENPVIANIAFQGNVNADKSKLEPLLGLKAQRALHGGQSACRRPQGS